MDFLRPKHDTDPNQTGRPRRNPLLWVVVIAAFVIYAQFEGDLFGDLNHASHAPIGGGDIGGPFELVDHTGKTVTDMDFRGKYMLVYFGYTACPDECPAELMEMGEAIDRLGDKAALIQPIFITFDPTRDTVEKLADYLPKFHPRFVGLTGSEEQVAKAASAYRVVYERKTEDEAATDYLIDHTQLVYLMGPDGKFLDYFSDGQGARTMAAAIQGYL